MEKWARQNIIKILEIAYLIIFIFSIGLIVTMHTLPAPALAVFRIPTQLREVGPMLGFTWPTSLEVYHAFLLLFFAVIILNGISLYRVHIKRWRSICRISSFLGLFIIWSVFLFFIFSLILDNNELEKGHIQSFLIYSVFAFVFLIVDLLTFAVSHLSYLQKERKQSFGE